MFKTDAIKLADTKVRKLDDGYWTAGYITPQDIAMAAACGFKSIVNILPKDDTDQHMTDAQAKELVETASLEYRYMPLYGHQVNNEYIATAYGSMIKELQKPVLTYCRSGTRVTLLWAMIRAGNLDVDDILDRALNNGYDIEVIKEDLEKMAKKYG
ncbi:MAG: TIGR01244 family phosphatase [bacterium]|nr:TIGR01244 family phosphatase [bacterium]